MNLAEEIDQEFGDPDGFFVLEPVRGVGKGDEFGLGAIAKAVLRHFSHQKTIAHAPEDARRNAHGAIRESASDELNRLADSQGIPVVATFMGKGALSARHPLHLGIAGCWGEYPATEATRNAFIPSEEELAYAQRVIAAMAEAERNGQAAVTVDGKMVDYANIRMIRRLMSFKGQA